MTTEKRLRNGTEVFVRTHPSGVHGPGLVDGSPQDDDAEVLVLLTNGLSVRVPRDHVLSVIADPPTLAVGSVHTLRRPPSGTTFLAGERAEILSYDQVTDTYEASIAKSRERWCVVLLDLVHRPLSVDRHYEPREAPPTYCVQRVNDGTYWGQGVWTVREHATEFPTEAKARNQLETIQANSPTHYAFLVVPAHEAAEAKADKPKDELEAALVRAIRAEQRVRELEAEVKRWAERVRLLEGRAHAAHAALDGFRDPGPAPEKTR
jgi:hypothetical protein